MYLLLTLQRYKIFLKVIAFGQLFIVKNIKLLIISMKRKVSENFDKFLFSETFKLLSISVLRILCACVRFPLVVCVPWQGWE